MRITKALTRTAKVGILDVGTAPKARRELTVMSQQSYEIQSYGIALSVVPVELRLRANQASLYLQRWSG
jgi:hypothetical protein